MRDTLRLFTNNSSLQESSEALLDKLGIKYSPLLRGIPFDDYFRQSGFTFHYVEELEKSIDHIWNIGYVNDTTFENAEANDENSKYFGLSIFACDIKSEVNFTRGMAVALTRAFNRISTQNVNNQFDMPVVVIMRQGEMLSLATCERSNRQDGHGERVGKVTILRDMNCSHLHAGHKQILERVKENVRGCKSYEELHQKWFESFNIDILSDNFFNGYKNIYEDIIEYITGKRMVKQANKWVEQDNKNPNAAIMAEFSCFEDPEKAVRDYVKKLMGRLVFIQFLQKKGWMGVPAGKSWNGGDPDFLQNLFHKSEEHKDDFVDKVLEPLFEALNTPRENDLFISRDVKLDKQIKVPYLNGGLFETNDCDKAKFKIPRKFFWNEDEKEAEKKPGILRLFSNFNFTIDENAPDNVEIGVDPEMLSRIFENLLEDNKEKGAFYTPKEIVRYMCQESLIAYLDTNTSIASEKIRKFVMSPEEGVYDIPDGKKGKLIEALKEVKICDPAIGSGAFPMGMLNELLHCHEVLSNQHNNRTDIKKSIIKENLYGVDIEKGAVDIARLRFWLSIVVDEETPSPMPNLDYKIMQGNSLIESFKGIDLSKLTYEKEDKTDKGDFSLFDDEKNRLQKTVSHLLASYYSCSDHDRKVKLQQEISETINKQLESQSYKSEILAQLKDINLAENNRFFLWHLWFSDVFARKSKSGFDIVVGNPPYIGEKGNKTIFQPVKGDVHLKDYYIGKMDYFYFFFHLAFNLLCPNGVVTFITTNYYPTALGARKLRADIKKRMVIGSLLNLGELRLFESAPGQHNMISSFIKGKSQCECKIIDVHKTGALNSRMFASIINGEDSDTSYAKVAQDDMFDGDENYIRLQNVNGCDPLSSVLEKMQKEAVKLGDIASVNTGLFTACDKVFIGDCEEIMRNISPDEFERTLLRPLFKNSDIYRYCTDNVIRKYVIYHYEKASYELTQIPNILRYLTVHKEKLQQRRDNSLKGALARGRWDVMALPKTAIDFSGPKIVCPQRSKINTFGYNECDWYASADVYYITKPDDSYSLKYILGLLNSKLYYVWLYNKGKRKGETLELYQKPLSEVPIKCVSQEVQDSIVSMVDEIMDLKQSDCSVDTSALEQKIDFKIYEVYGLTNSEVRRVDPSAPIKGKADELFKADHYNL